MFVGSTKIRLGLVAQMARAVRFTSMILAMGFASPAAAASQWFIVTPLTSNPQAVQMADASSIRGNNASATVWTHFFYSKAQGRLKSYLLQYGINCETREVREMRFVDFGADYETLESGDNSESNEGQYRSVAPGTIGDLTVTFACETAQYRKKAFIEVGTDQDYRKVAEFFLERGELVKTK